MTPQLGDTLFNRYTLVSSLRGSTGLQAWKANDRVLARDCQVMVITVPGAVDQVDAIAASLAMSRNDRFTPVQMFERVEDCALLVMHPDAGVALTEYLEGPGRDILSYDAIRSIIGDVAYAMDSTHEDALLSTDTIRISAQGVSVADAPVKPLLADPTHAPEGMGGEQLIVRQLAGVLAALLTRTPSQHFGTFSLDMLPADVPSDFRVIIARGLELKEGGRAAEPMMSVNELKALLGYWRTVPDLGPQDIVFPAIAGAPSIEIVALRPMDNVDLAELPASLVTSERLPLLNIAGTAESEEASDAEETAGVAGLAGVSAMAGVAADADEAEPAPVPQAAQEQVTRSIFPEEPTTDGLFHEFGNADSLGAMATMPIDVSQLRAGAADSLGPGEATTRIPIIGSQTPLSVQLNQAEAQAPVQPPSFTPAEPAPAADDEDNLSDTKLFGKLTTKAVVMIVVAVLMAIALAIAVISLSGGRTKQEVDRDSWPNQQELEQVPFGTPASGDQSGQAGQTGQAGQGGQTQQGGQNAQ
ncbi:hypothetical protein [Bifidobacterium pullorum]|uniref:hypothetical protein n=1 Tax=Bifidobacterium pullorum TaxID=78448 RepID=UPI001EF4004A|nr:hypothetical protein [Bifidobacterium pullorum]